MQVAIARSVYMRGMFIYNVRVLAHMSLKSAHKLVRLYMEDLMLGNVL